MFTKNKNKHILPKQQVLFAILSACLLLMLFISVIPTVSAADEAETTTETAIETETETEEVTLKVSINYLTEQIVFDNGDYNLKDGGKPVYMYSPNVSLTSTAKKQAAEKWYPVYGNTIDIQQYIPATADKECIFAVRLASDIPQENGTYKTREIVIIAGRSSMSAADLKRRVAYNPLSEKIEVDDYLSTMGYDFKIDLGEWNYNMKEDLKVSSRFMSLGGVVTIRQSANQSLGVFASLPIKVKIPKAPPTPNVKVNTEKERITGIAKNTGWSAYEDGPYKEFNNSVVEFDLFEAKLMSIDSFDTVTVESSDGRNTEYVIVYIKTLATEKKPSSATKVLYIPLNLLEE